MIWTNVICRPSGALGCLVCRVFYKHAAPLGLKAESNWLPRQRWSRWGSVSVFNPCNPLIRVIRDLDKCYMSPLWGFGYLLCCVFYKHAAPLGLKAESNWLPRQRRSRWGSVSVFNPCNPLIRVIRDLDKCYMSPLWGFGYLLCCVFYKHAAPLGLNEPMKPPQTR